MNALQELDAKNMRGQITELELCILMAGTLCAPEKAAEQLATLSTNCDKAIKANIEVAKLNVDLQERVAELESAIVWALGYTDFPQRKDGEGNFYWRTELHKRANIAHEQAMKICEKGES